VRDIRGHAARLKGSPFFEHLRSAPISKAVVEAATLKWDETDKHLQEYLQTNIAEIRDDLLGDGFVFAFWPGKEQREERGLFLARARKPELLTKIAERLTELETKSGNVTAVEKRQHKGIDYVRRSEKRGETNFVLVRAGLVAFSPDETTLQAVIDRLPNPSAESPIWRQIRDFGLTDVLAVLWLNPRAFDDAIQAKTDGAPAAEVAFQRTFLAQWKRTTAAAFAVRLDKDLTVSVHVRGEVGAAGADRDGALSALWSRFPEQPIVAVAGLADFSALGAMLSAAAPPEAKDKSQAGLNFIQGVLSRDLQKEVLPNLGPRWGFYVAAPAGKRTDWFPDIAFALELRSPPSERPLDQAFLDTVRTLAGVVVLTHAGTDHPTKLKQEQQDKATVLSLVNDKLFPPGFQPAFTVKHSYLLVASGPEAIRRFGEAGKSTPAMSAESSSFEMRLSFLEAVKYLGDKDRRAKLVTAIAQAHGQTEAEVAQQIEQFTSVLELVQLGTVSISGRPGQMDLTMRLRLRFAKPLQR
jgi:hypothetical protein